MKKKILSIFIILLFLYLPGCLENNNNDFDDYVLNIGMSQDISGFYPWIVRDITSLSVNQNFFNPLVEIDNETRGIIPSLAVSWNNPDDFTWRFFLQRDVRFHNGDDFTAWDVKFTLEFLKNFSFYYDRFSSLKNITVIDNYTIELETENIDYLLLYDLITVNILSEKYINSILDTNETWPVGTGAYKLKEYVPGVRVTLKRFDDYWKGAPNIKEVNFIVKNTTEALLDGVLSGELDISPISFDDIGKIIDNDDLKLLSVETPGVVYLGFDCRVNNSYAYPDGMNPTSDARVRKAMYYTINIDDFIDEKLNIKSRFPISQFITSNTFGYNPNINRLEYNIDEAKMLMREAGYEDGFNITLDCPNSENAILMGQTIADYLSLINISVELNFMPSNDVLRELYFKNTSFYITAFSPLTAESSIRLLLHTSDMDNGIGIWNYGNYSNKEVDNLYSILNNISDPTYRKKLIQDIFSIAMDDVAWIPLYSSKAFYAVDKDISWNPRPSLYIIVDDINFNKN